MVKKLIFFLITQNESAATVLMACWALFSVFVICCFYCTHDNIAGGGRCIPGTGVAAGTASQARTCTIEPTMPVPILLRNPPAPRLVQLSACAIVSSGQATFSIMNGAVALFSIHYLRVLSANLFRQQTSGGQRIRTLARPIWFWVGGEGCRVLALSAKVSGISQRQSHASFGNNLTEIVWILKRCMR